MAPAGGLHTLPQAPQLNTSSSVGMQSPLHFAKPAAHWMSHRLFAQTAEPFAGMAQPCPHPPQLAALVFVSTQLPLQGVSAPQLAVHVPPRQFSPTAHALPHCPQFAES